MDKRPEHDQRRELQQKVVLDTDAELSDVASLQAAAADAKISISLDSLGILDLTHPRRPGVQEKLAEIDQIIREMKLRKPDLSAEYLEEKRALLKQHYFSHDVLRIDAEELLEETLKNNSEVKSVLARIYHTYGPSIYAKILHGGNDETRVRSFKHDLADLLTAEKDEDGEYKIDQLVAYFENRAEYYSWFETQNLKPLEKQSEVPLFNKIKGKVLGILTGFLSRQPTEKQRDFYDPRSS